MTTYERGILNVGLTAEEMTMNIAQVLNHGFYQIRTIEQKNMRLIDEWLEGKIDDTELYALIEV